LFRRYGNANAEPRRGENGNLMTLRKELGMVGRRADFKPNLPARLVFTCELPESKIARQRNSTTTKRKIPDEKRDPRGCDNKPAPKANENKPLEINAPGVEVKVDPQRGVDVKAPGVDVETK